jgi:Tol biopolymer transport system component
VLLKSVAAFLIGLLGASAAAAGAGHALSGMAAPERGATSLARSAAQLVGLLVYDDGYGSRTEIATLDGRRHWTVTATPPGVESDPKWAPDGRRIAFVARTKTHLALYVVNADGRTGLRVLARFVAPGGPPLDRLSFAWSPDGRRLALATSMASACRVGRRQLSILHLYIVDANGGRLRALPIAAGTAHFERWKLVPIAIPILTWGHSGRTLLYTVDWGISRPTDYDSDCQFYIDSLHVVRADGMGSRRLVAPNEPIGGAAWSWDERRIAFAECQIQGGCLGVTTINSDGSQRRVLPHSGGLNFEEPVAWLPDGKVVFGGDKLYSETPGSDRRNTLPRSRIDPYILDVSADGHQVAFVGLSGSHAVLRVADLDTHRTVDTRVPTDLPTGDLTSGYVANKDVHLGG